MSGVGIAALGFAAMLLLIAVRMPVGLSMLVTGAGGYVYLSGWSPFLAYMKTNPTATTGEIHAGVEKRLGKSVPPSSVRSYLRLNAGSAGSGAFERVGRGRYRLKQSR